MKFSVVGVTDLSKVGRVPHHVDVEELGHVPGPSVTVVTFEGSANVGTLF